MQEMTSTHEKVGSAPEGKYAQHTPYSAARDIESALAVLEGRWKMLILCHLFATPVLRFSELERAIPAVSQKMLTQQLRELEKDCVVCRTVFPEVPPRVEYSLTPLGQALCPALDAVLKWEDLRRATQPDAA